MKKRQSALMMLIAVMCMFQSCAFFSEYAKLERDARSAYSRADYNSAVFMLASSLRINPEYEKSQYLIADAFVMANRTHLKQIKTLKEGTDPFKHDNLVREYQSLINLHDAVESLPPIRHPKTHAALEFDIVDYSDELSEATRNAAETHYTRGTELAISDLIGDQKAAAKEFKRALHFVPGYKDAETKYEKSRQAGIKRIAFVPFENASGKQRFGAIEKFVVDEVVSSIMKDPAATEFLELVSRDQLDRVIEEQKLSLSGLVSEKTAVQVGEILGVNEILTGTITQIIYTPEQTVSRSYIDKRKVVVKQESYTDNDGKKKTRDIYGEVSARVTRYTRSSKAEIKGSYKIVDVMTSKLVESETFVGRSEFKTEWATFRGDARALSYGSRRLISREEVPAPVAAEMVNRAAVDLSKNLAARLKLYAR